MEEENLKLRLEMSHIKTETIDLEDREKELVSDALRQLNDANAHINKVTAQLEKKTDECVAQQVAGRGFGRGGCLFYDRTLPARWT